MLSDVFLERLKPLYLRAEYWVPRVVLDSMLKAACLLRYWSFADKGILKKNSELKGVAKGKRAFLIATGPSLKKEDLKQLEGEDCFSLSNFYLHPDLDVVNPKFYFVGAYHKPLILENFVDWLKILDRKLPSQTKMMLSQSNIDLVRKHMLFETRDVYYLYIDYLPPFIRQMDITRPVLAPQTGPLLALPVLLYMGYKTIYLLGCDHTVMRDYKKTTTNFYSPEQEMRKNSTSGKFWPDCTTQYRAGLRVIEQYDFYKRSLKRRDASIVNLSVDSWLDIFPFARLDDVVNSGHDHIQ